QLTPMTPIITPERIPTVAIANAKSPPPSKPSSSITGAIPAAVPWPPSKPISMRAPNIGVTLNSGTSTATTNNMPITYWPAAKVTPSDSWGPKSLTARFGEGSSVPRNNPANTTLINSPGSSPHTSRTLAPKIPPSDSASEPNQDTTRPSIWGPRNSPTNPAIIDTGRNSFCTVLLRARMYMPISARTPSRRIARLTVDGVIANLSSGIRYSSSTSPATGQTINNSRQYLRTRGSAANSPEPSLQAQSLDH